MDLVFYTEDDRIKKDNKCKESLNFYTKQRQRW